MRLRLLETRWVGFSCEGAIEAWEHLQLKQLRDISLALVNLHDMPFYDERRGRSCYRGRDESEDGEGRFEHCGLLARMKEEMEEQDRVSQRHRSECIYVKERRDLEREREG